MDESQVISFFEKLEEVIDKTSKATSELSSHNKDLRASEDEIFKSIKNGLSPSKESLALYKKQIDIKNKYEAAIEKLTKSETKNIEITKKTITAINASHQAFNKTISSIAKFAGSASAAGFSFSELSKTIIDYNQNLFEISRAQQVAGKGGSDLSSALAYVRNNVLLSDVAFAELAKTIQSTFIGVKPSMMDITKQLEIWGKQTGYDYKSFTELAQIQAQFPQLAEAWGKAMEAVDKINSGMGTTEDENRLDIYKNQTMVLAKMGHLGSAVNDRILATTTPLTAAQKELNTLKKQQMELDQALGNAQKDFAQAFTPILTQILKLSTGVLKTFSEYKEIIIWTAGIGVGLKGVVSGLTSAASMAKFFGANVKLAADGTAIMSAGVAASAIAWGSVAAAVLYTVKLVHDVKRTQDELAQTAQDAAKDKEAYAKVQGDILKLTEEQKEEYNKLWLMEKQGPKTAGEILDQHQKIYTQITQTEKPLNVLFKEYETIEKSVAKQLEILGYIGSALQADTDIAEQFGGRSKAALESLIDISKLELGQSMKKMNSSMEIAVKMLREHDKDFAIDIDIKGDPVKVIEKLLQKSNELNVSAEEREQINQVIASASQDAADAKAKEGKIVKNIVSDMEVNIRQQEQVTTLYETRLAIERQLMESAQFGLGASVEMMQKQVDLANKMAKEYEKMDKSFEERLTKEKDGKTIANKKDIEAIQNASTQAEAEDYIVNTMKKEGQEKELLTEYAKKHQEYKTKEMQQQQKIYDLTKNIREGYLDAMREMSVGAGEFDKIIGKQEMGVTQLQKAIKDTTGEFKGNTFKLGGSQASSATAAGVGTQVTGQMTTGGLKFIGGSTQEARNQRINQYGASTANVAGIGQGKVSDTAPRVGTGTQPQFQDTYSGAFRQPGNQIGGGGYFSPNANPMSVVNQGVMRGKFNVGETKRMQGGVPAGILGSQILNARPAPIPASGGGVPGIGTMQLPGFQGAGGSEATVTIKLGNNIEGEITKLSNMKVQLEKASR